MKLTTFVSTLALGAVLTVPAMQASGAFIPPPGEISLKFTGGTNLFTDGSLAPIGRAQEVLPGDESFTAMTMTSYTVDFPANSFTYPGEVTAVVTYLELDRIVETDGLPSRFDFRNSNRNPEVLGTDPVTGNPLIGRFFLFDSSGTPNAGKFSVTDGIAANGIGGTPSDIDFGSGLFGGFAGDELSNFTDGILLATGNIVARSDGTVQNPVNYDIDPPLANQLFTGSIGELAVVVDGGLWFDLGVTDRLSFKANQVGFGSGPTKPVNAGDQDVFDGGWAISLQDPIQFTASNPIPEPVSIGLAGLGLLAATGAATRRRRG